MNPRKKPEASKQEDEQEQEDESQRVARSLYLARGVVEDARAAVHYLSAYVPESGVKSMSDIFEEPGRKEIERLQKKYNNGEPFPRLQKRLR